MKTFLCALALVSLVAPVVSENRLIVPENRLIVSQDKPSVPIGVWELQGAKDDGSKLSGIAIIKPRADKGDYLIQLTMGVGNNITGFGIADGGHLAVALISTNGVALFTISKDGKTLTGTWAIGDEDTGTMTLTYDKKWPQPKT